jgi:hypothetical protein
MSNDRSRYRGNLFENTEKKKPSQPDFQGDCTIDGVAYEIRGWQRDEQLTINIAPPRGDGNTYPPDVFKGALEAVPRKKPSRHDKAAPPAPVWVGTIVSDEAAYKISAFEKQGKSGMYFTLSFEPAEREAKQPEFDSEQA